MTSRVRRRRAAVLMCLALACGGLAASEVRSKVRAVEARVGAPVAVLVASRDVAPGKALTPSDLALREVPERFAPPDALPSRADAVGAVPAGPLARGAYITTSTLGAGPGGGDSRPLRRGERALELAVTGGGPLTEDAGPGSRVDVLVSTATRSFLALENVEVLDLSEGARAASPGDGEGAAARATATATLRVTLRQAVYLSAAQNFAREVRLLARPAGDRSRAGRAAVSAGEL